MHARHKDSHAIKHPERPAGSGPATVEQHLALYLRQAAAGRRRDPRSFPQAAVEAKVAEIRAYWAAKGAADG